MTSGNGSGNGANGNGVADVRSVDQSINDQLVPSEIRLSHSRDCLTVSFEKHSFEFSAEFLRVFSPSAEVQGHSEAERKLQFGKSKVLITEIEPVGNYAIRVHFSDGHNSGFYSWAYLNKLGTEHDILWAGYLAELEDAGLSR